MLVNDLLHAFCFCIANKKCHPRGSTKRAPALQINVILAGQNTLNISRHLLISGFFIFCYILRFYWQIERLLPSRNTCLKWSARKTGLIIFHLVYCNLKGGTVITLDSIHGFLCSVLTKFCHANPTNFTIHPTIHPSHGRLRTNNVKPWRTTFAQMHCEVMVSWTVNSIEMTRYFQ